MPDNFNYIAFGDPIYVKDVQTIGMSRGRMFEYTPTDIEKRLEDLGEESISFLEKLPTFLCSEIMRNEDGASMIVRYGSIEVAEVGRKEVSARFEALIDFGEVQFADIDQARTIFGADGFQLYRTHWAVREGDIKGILLDLADLKPEFEQLVGAQAPNPGAAEPPQHTKKTLGTADSIEAFLQLLYGPSADETETFFRGHTDSSYELTPSLLRKWPDGTWMYMPNEDRLCKELLIAHYDEFQADQYCFDRLVRMQHYGLPTRLLDISSNPLVALFFACYGGGRGPSEKEGEVIIFRVRSDKVKYYDSDTVSCLANLSSLTFAQKNDIDLTQDLDTFNGTDVAKKLLHHIKSEKGYFEARIVPDDLGSVACVKAKRTNTRIKSQAGAFLLFGQDAALPETGQEGIEIARVTITNKLHILSQLDSINVNASTVYPSIDQTTIHLRDRYQAAQSA